MEFRLYENLLELRFDYENALGIDSLGTKFYFIYARTSDKNVKPLYIEYVDEEGVLQQDNSEEIVAKLGYMPILKIPRDDAPKGFAKAYIHNKTYSTMRRIDDIDNVVAKEANDAYNTLISSKKLSTTDNVSYVRDFEELNRDIYKLHPKMHQNIGILIDDDKTLLSKSKSVCEQAYNGISNYNKVVLLDIRTFENDVKVIGQFYVDNGNPVPPPHEEHLAMIRNGTVIDYFYDV